MIDARTLAARSMWSDKPLVQAFTARTGRVSFSLRELTAFAEQLPHVEFASIAAKTGAP
jgi:hypothetical protein